MASNEIYMKQISEDLEIFLTKEIENNIKEITEKMIEKMNTKFVKPSTRIETVNRNAVAGESLSKENQNNISNLPSQSTANQENLAGEEYT